MSKSPAILLDSLRAGLTRTAVFGTQLTVTTDRNRPEAARRLDYLRVTGLTLIAAGPI